MENLDNWPVAPYFPVAYYLGMENKAFRNRVIDAMKDKRMSKAELSRRSRVPYHAIDKFLKRENATTGAENAAAMANVLEIKVDEASEYDRFRSLYYRLNEENRANIEKIMEGLL